MANPIQSQPNLIRAGQAAAVEQTSTFGQALRQSWGETFAGSKLVLAGRIAANLTGIGLAVDLAIVSHRHRTAAHFEGAAPASPSRLNRDFSMENPLRTETTSLTGLHPTSSTAPARPREGPGTLLQWVTAPLARFRDFMNSRTAGRDMTGARFVPQNEAQVEAGFAGGAMAKLDRITYRDGTVGMFKADARTGEFGHTPSQKSGIPKDHASANLSARAVATSHLDKALGFDLVPTTEFAVHGGRGGTVQEFAQGQGLLKRGFEKTSLGPPDFGVFFDIYAGGLAKDSFSFATNERGAGRMAELRGALESYGKECSKQPGVSPPPDLSNEIEALLESGDVWITKVQTTSLGSIDLAAPSVQQSLSDAHVMDLLTGQLDRNSGNFIFSDSGNGSPRTRLIDNDLSFGAKFTSLDRDSMLAINSAFLPPLPRLIDAGTADRVLGMTPDALRTALAGSGLGEAERSAAASRLEQLQAHIGLIKASAIPGGQLVTSWNAETFEALLKAPDNYVQRSVSDQSISIAPLATETAILTQDIESGGHAMNGLTKFWGAEKNGSVLRNDVQGDRRLVDALVRHQPLLLGEMLAKASSEDRKAVVDGLLGTQAGRDLASLLKSPAGRPIAEAMVERHPTVLQELVSRLETEAS